MLIDMKIWIITLLPEYFKPLMELGVVGQAISGLRGSNIDIKIISLANFSPKNFKGVDDPPYGGGPGMVMRPDVLKRALFEGVIFPGNYGDNFKEKLHVIYPTPRGQRFDNKISKRLALGDKDLVFICGRYEGIDERFIDIYVDEEISLGDFVLSGAEIASMAFIDSLLRFKDGVLGNSESYQSESFESPLLDYPQYTRPQEFEGLFVPEILLSGHHENIKKYRIEESLRITKKYRPDLLLKKDNK